MCDDDERPEYEELDYFDLPESEPGGYNMLYPGDPIRQAEAMWADMEQASDQAPVGPCESPNILLRLFLFFLCLAFPPSCRWSGSCGVADTLDDRKKSGAAA